MNGGKDTSEEIYKTYISLKSEIAGALNLINSHQLVSKVNK